MPVDDLSLKPDELSWNKDSRSKTQIDCQSMQEVQPELKDYFYVKRP